jgi:spore maturation protein CgeB
LRVTIVDTYYEAFLDRFYAARPELGRASYDEQWRALMDMCFGTFDAYSHHLAALGHEATEIVPNCASLQTAWAREQGAARLESRLLGVGVLANPPVRYELFRRIALAQIRAQDPDVVYCQTLSFLRRPQLDALRRDGRLVVGQIASPLPSDELLAGFDLVLTSFPHFVERIKAIGPDSVYLPLAFDARILDRLPGVGAPRARREHEVVFVGGVNPEIHREGTSLLERLCREREVAVWGYGADALPTDSAIRRSYRGEAWGLDMYEVFANARLVVNRHIDAAEGHANNMRLFEATGSGAALVTEAADNLAELFDPGREVFTYYDFGQLLDTIDRARASDSDRVTVAAAGQQRTLARHTYAQRMAELVEILEPRLSGAGRRRRPARAES